jgi:putative methyltransferase
MQKIKIISIDYFNEEEHYLSFVNYYLRLHYDLNSKDNTRFKWTLPENLTYKSSGVTQNKINQILELIDQEKIDVLGFSVYVWNRSVFKTVGQAIKNKFPNIIIIGGGPELDAHKNEDFFNLNPYYDYVIYGDGEQAFTNLLDHIAGMDSSLLNTVEKNGTVHPHVVFNDKQTLSQSPYLKYKDEINELVGKKRKEIQIEFHKQVDITGIWETTKGCPYSCSFCDWSSGLHNKVRFWGKKEKFKEESRPNYELELDFFSELKLNNIMWTNPNVGLSPSDESIVDYWCELADRNSFTPKVQNLQLSKINKEQSFALKTKLLKAGVDSSLKFDVQDIDPEVIANLDRPEIPWADHKVLIKNLIDKFPQYAQNSRINFIWGLPGQTLLHYDRNLLETSKLGLYPNFFLFEWLPNAPASDPEYMRKFNLTVEKVYVNYVPITNQTTRKITNDFTNRYFSETNLIVSNYSLTKKDWYLGVVKNYLFQDFLHNYRENEQFIKIFLDNFYLYESVTNEMYQHFLEYKLISIRSHYLLNHPIYYDFTIQLRNVSQQLIKKFL